MKYSILFSLLLVGVCSGNTHDYDEKERMPDMGRMGSDEDSNKRGDWRIMKTLNEESPKQSYNSWRQSFEAQRQGYDTKKQSYDFQSQDDSQKQNYDPNRQDYNPNRQDYNPEKQSYDSKSQSYDSQRQGFYSMKPNFDSQKPSQTHQNLNWVDYNLKRDSDQNRDDSSVTVEKGFTKVKGQSIQPDNRRPQSFLGLGELAKHVGDYFRGVFGWGSNSGYVAKVYSDQVPSLKDPLDIGEFDTSFAVITTKYNNVWFYGLNKAYEVVLDVDTKNYQVVAQIPLGKVEIKGQYTYSNRPTHNFTVILSDTVYVQTTSYTIKDNFTQLGQSSGRIQYSHENSMYDRIGFLAQVLQGQLGKHLVNSAAPKVYEYISPKLTNLIERTIADVTQNFQRAQIVSSLKVGVNETVRKIQQHLNSSGNASVVFNSQSSQEYLYHQYRAQLQSVSLQNVQNLTLVSNNVTYTDKMVHSYINLSLSQPMISTRISYRSNQDNEQHEIHVQYWVDNIHAKLELHKDLSGGPLQLVSVKVYVSNVHTAPSQGYYKPELEDLVNFLGSKLEHYISDLSENFLTSQVRGILAKVNPAQTSYPGPGQEYKYGNGYSGDGKYYGNGPFGTGEYSGYGYTGMGQYGTDQNSGSGSSGYNYQKYPGSVE